MVWDLSVDSTVCRAHQHATGSRKQGELQKDTLGGIFAGPRDHGLGRSRGGFNIRLHLAVEQGQKPMPIVVTADWRGDSPRSNRCWLTSACPASVGAGLVAAPAAYGPTRHTPPAGTGGCGINRF